MLPGHVPLGSRPNVGINFGRDGPTKFGRAKNVQKRPKFGSIRTTVKFARKYLWDGWTYNENLKTALSTTTPPLLGEKIW